MITVKLLKPLMFTCMFMTLALTQTLNSPSRYGEFSNTPVGINPRASIENSAMDYSLEGQLKNKTWLEQAEEYKRANTDLRELIKSHESKMIRRHKRGRES